MLRRLSACEHRALNRSATEYKEYPGRAHFIAGEDGWEEVADYALAWSTEHAAS